MTVRRIDERPLIPVFGSDVTVKQEIAVYEAEFYLDHFYVRPEGLRGRPPRAPGTPLAHGASVVRFLGYRVVPGEQPRTNGLTVYLVRCSHGLEGPVFGHRFTDPGWGGHFYPCYRIMPLCAWCGTTDPYAFPPNKVRGACQACDRQGHRVGVHGCGKPIRPRAPHREPEQEHVCDLCSPWPRKR